LARSLCWPGESKRIQQQLGSSARLLQPAHKVSGRRGQISIDCAPDAPTELDQWARTAQKTAPNSLSHLAARRQADTGELASSEPARCRHLAAAQLAALLYTTRSLRRGRSTGAQTNGKRHLAGKGELGARCLPKQVGAVSGPAHKLVTRELGAREREREPDESLRREFRLSLVQAKGKRVAFGGRPPRQCVCVFFGAFWASLAGQKGEHLGVWGEKELFLGSFWSRRAEIKLGLINHWASCEVGEWAA